MESLLKFITCGSVDDGKSTLIGHMLYDAKLIFADQKRALELDSKVGSREGNIDYSLLLDGLMAEREQGITIDVAYRYFATENRSFIVADTPGHEEYTRNMAVGASFASLAVILTDASQGVLVQTRRHAGICSLMGIKHFVFAVNKMDLVDYDIKIFEKIQREINGLMSEFDFKTLQIIPVSATEGDNITKTSDRMQWYKGVPLLKYLEEVDVKEDVEVKGFSMPVQRVCRPNYNFRGFQGQISSGKICRGDDITVLPSGEKATVKEIYEGDKKVNQSSKGHGVTIQLDSEIDISRGCIIEKNYSLLCGMNFSICILWMDDKKLVEGRNFLMKVGTKLVPATITKINYKIDVNTGSQVYAKAIFKNEIAFCEVTLGEKIVVDKFINNRELGSLILIDRVSNMTSACGQIAEIIDNEKNLTWHEMDVTKELRERQLSQKAFTVWMTGLSGSGKSTLANALEKRLFTLGKHTMLLDGDNIRMGLNKNLGFNEGDRVENIRRIAEVAKLMNDAGLIVITSFISPYSQDRQSAKEIIGDDFVEVYVSTPLDECERRDVKGLYKEARKGNIRSFTGISSPYEIPETPDVEIDTSGKKIEDCVNTIIDKLKKYIEE